MTSVEELEPQAGGVAVGDLAERAQAFAVASRAPATLDAYRSDWEHFAAWMEAHGYRPLPAGPEHLALYVAAMAESYRPSTITRRLSAIAVAHQVAGHESPTRHAVVRSVVTGIRRTLGTAPAQVAPATIGEIRRMVAHMSDTTIDRRDAVVLLLGFAGAFRRSELVALDVADLAEADNGMTVTVRRSKADQEGRGDTKAIPFGSDPATCPVRAVQAWTTVADITEGPLLRPVDRHGNVGPARLSDRAVALIIKRAAERAGLDPTRYSGHSLRAGMITTAAAAGASERAIARQTGHAPGSNVLRSYVRHASPFVDNAVADLGL